MELPFSISFMVFIVALFLIIITIHFRSLNSFNKNKNLPPQPWKLPLIGHIHHLLGEQPHRALGKIAEKLGPIVHLKLGEVSCIIISSPNAAKEIMKTHDLSFADRPKMLTAEIIGYNYSDIIFSPYNDYWRQMRKICALELLSIKKVQSFASIREEESWKLVESIMATKATQKTINLTEKSSMTVNAIVCRVAVGSRCKDHKKLVALIDEQISLSSGFCLSDLFPSIKILPLVTGMRNKLMKLRNKFDEIFETIISYHQEHRADGDCKNENEDFLDVMLRLKNDGGLLSSSLSYDNIKVIIHDVLGAGTDTSSATFEWAMSELMNNPRVIKKAQSELREALKGNKRIYESDIQDLNYLKLVIKETLRLHPSGPLLIPRVCRENCEVGGYNIKVGTRVIINAWKIGHDSDYWTDPSIFIPERFSDGSNNKIGTNFEYIPFGAGRRMCPGMTMGLSNVELPLAMLLYHFDWDLPNGETYENLDMSDVCGVTLKRKNPLLLVPRLYNIN